MELYNLKCFILTLVFVMIVKVVIIIIQNEINNLWKTILKTIIQFPLS